MLFADVIGHEDVKRRLRQSVAEGRIAHAQLFCGVEGTGTLPLALAYAQYVCCPHRTATDACGECPSCVQIAKLAHPDLHFVFPTNRNKERFLSDHYVQEFRDLMTENPYATYSQWMMTIAENKKLQIFAAEGSEIVHKLMLKPYESEYRVMIIWHPELMRVECANHVLKILEEPADKTLFLLVTNHPDEILGTIQSRAQCIPVPPLTVDELSAAARERYNLPEAEALQLSRLAQGSWSQLCELIDQSSEQQRNFEFFRRMLRIAWALNVKEIMAWSAELKALGREGLCRYFQYTQRMVRENFVLRMANPNISYMNAEEQAFAAKFSPYVNERNIEAMMNELALAEAQIEQNGNADIILLDLCGKLYRLLHK